MNNSGFSPEQLTNMLIMILMIMVVLLVTLGIVYIFIKIKGKKKNDTSIQSMDSNETVSDARKIAKEYTKESIYKFMEFQKIEDNMIVQKKGMRYLMAIECQGINYDLMSEGEKNSVEEGFLQFLNTLRHPIQIYVQTRKVNLGESINTYKRKVDDIRLELDKKKDVYQRKVQTENYSKEELQKDFYEITKQTNLYEYGKDIIENTERMSLNKNVLNKKYYIIIPYYPDDLGNNAFDKEEIKNIAFSELYTKAQSLIRTLSSCEVKGKIMSSNQLVDLLYIAYNRDEAEIYGIEKALRSGYEELYTTAPDIFEKKIKLLNEQMEREALVLANQKVIVAKSEKQKELERQESEFREIVRERARIILEQSEEFIGNETAQRALELLNKEKEVKEKKAKKATNKIEEGGQEDVSKEKKTTTRRSTTRTTN